MQPVPGTFWATIGRWLHDNAWWDIPTTISGLVNGAVGIVKFTFFRPHLKFVYGPEAESDDHSHDVKVFYDAPQGQRMNVPRHYCVVRVENRGWRLATGCSVEAEVLRSLDGCVGPFQAAAKLAWMDGDRTIEIRPRGDSAKLLVVFAEQTFHATPSEWHCASAPDGKPQAFHAYLATPESVAADGNAEKAHGLCNGEFEVLLTVRCNEGAKAKGRFIIKSDLGDLQSGAHLFPNGGSEVTLRRSGGRSRWCE